MMYSQRFFLEFYMPEKISADSPDAAQSEMHDRIMEDIKTASFCDNFNADELLSQFENDSFNDAPEGHLYVGQVFVKLNGVYDMDDPDGFEKEMGRLLHVLNLVAAKLTMEFNDTPDRKVIYFGEESSRLEAYDLSQAINAATTRYAEITNSSNTKNVIKPRG